MNRKQIFKIIDKFKGYVGLADYNILLNTKPVDLGESIARIEICMFEKELNLILTPNFYECSNKRQRNILIHEMVHVRIGLFHLRTEKVKSLEEELLVNDLTRGMERLK